MMTPRRKVRKLVSRAMEDMRGLDERYPDKEDATELAETLNELLEHTVTEIMIATDQIDE